MEGYTKLAYPYWVQEQSGQVAHSSPDSQSGNEWWGFGPSATDRQHGRISEGRHQSLCGRSGRALLKAVGAEAGACSQALTSKQEAEKGVRRRRGQANSTNAPSEVKVFPRWVNLAPGLAGLSHRDLQCLSRVSMYLRRGDRRLLQILWPDQKLDSKITLLPIPTSPGDPEREV